MKFKHLIDDIAVYIWFSRNFASMEDIRRKCNPIKNLSSNKKILNGVVALGYNFTQYIFIKSEFWQIYHWITFSSYIVHACKISRKSKINSYVINKLFKLKVLVI